MIIKKTLLLLALLIPFGSHSKYVLPEYTKEIYVDKKSYVKWEVSVMGDQDTTVGKLFGYTKNIIIITKCYNSGYYSLSIGSNTPDKILDINDLNTYGYGNFKVFLDEKAYLFLGEYDIDRSLKIFSALEYPVLEKNKKYSIDEIKLLQKTYNEEEIKNLIKDTRIMKTFIRHERKKIFQDSEIYTKTEVINMDGYKKALEICSQITRW